MTLRQCQKFKAREDAHAKVMLSHDLENLKVDIGEVLREEPRLGSQNEALDGRDAATVQWLVVFWDQT